MNIAIAVFLFVALSLTVVFIINLLEDNNSRQYGGSFILGLFASLAWSIFYYFTNHNN